MSRGPNPAPPSPPSAVALERTTAAYPNIGLMVRYTFRCFTRMLQVVAEAQGISAAEFRVIRSLEDGGPLTQLQIAAHAAMDRPYAALIVKQLRAKQLAEASPDPDDLRRVNIRLTPEGVRIRRVVDGQLKRVNEIARRGVTPADFAIFVRVMDQLRENLEGLERDEVLGEYGET